MHVACCALACATHGVFAERKPLGPRGAKGDAVEEDSFFLCHEHSSDGLIDNHENGGKIEGGNELRRKLQNTFKRPCSAAPQLPPSPAGGRSSSYPGVGVTYQATGKGGFPGWVDPPHVAKRPLALLCQMHLS